VNVLRKSLRAAALGSLCLLIVPAAVAATKPPAKPVKGARYEGATVRGKAAMTLKVAKNGKTVQVSLPILPTYCATPGHVQVQHTSPAKISSSGAFSATISYEGLFTSGTTGKAYLKAKFNGRRATGSVRSEFLQVKGCDGSTTFAVAVPAPAKKK
jgi:hypothetical protein